MSVLVPVLFAACVFLLWVRVADWFKSAADDPCEPTSAWRDEEER